MTHGERGEDKPRNGDRIHTSEPVYLLMVLQGHREDVALLVVWHHDIYHNVSSSFYTYCIINYQKISLYYNKIKFLFIHLARYQHCLGARLLY